MTGMSAAPGTEDLLVAFPTNGVAVLTLNRPHALNAMTPDLLATLTAEVARLGHHDALHALVITGAGRAFSAGGDMHALQAMSTAEQGPYLNSYAVLHETIADSDVPVIAALNGHAFGGGLEVACMADARIVDPSARLCVGDIALGLVPTGALTWKLPRLIGEGRARWLALSNETLSAAQAVEIGLCNVLAEPGQSVAAAVALATKIGMHPRHAAAHIRQAFEQAARGDRDESAAFEVTANLECLQHPDTIRAVTEFFTPDAARSRRADVANSPEVENEIQP